MGRRVNRKESQWTSAAARRLLKLAKNAADIPSAVVQVVDELLPQVRSSSTDLEALAATLNVIRFQAEPLPISGELRREPNGFVVVYSSYLSAQRRRFTIAHELAHAVFERSGPNCPRSGQELERLCDMLATEMLMPKKLFLERSGPASRLTWDRIQDLGKQFQTSLSATALRCAELLGVSVFEVEEDRIAWGYGAVRKGVVARLDNDLRQAIDNGKARDNFDDQLFIRTDISSHDWWNFESKTIREGERLMVLMRRLGPNWKEPEIYFPPAD